MSIRDLLRDRLGRDPAGICFELFAAPAAVPVRAQAREPGPVRSRQEKAVPHGLSGIFSPGFLTDVTMLHNLRYSVVNLSLHAAVAYINLYRGRFRRIVWGNWQLSLNAWLDERDFDLARGVACNWTGISGYSCANCHRNFQSSIPDLIRDRLGRDPSGIVLKYLRCPLPFVQELLKGHRRLLHRHNFEGTYYPSRSTRTDG